MKRSIARRQGITATLIAVFGLFGCIEYRIETSLNADASGTRGERIEVDENDDADYKPTPDGFVSLMNVSEAAGWAHATEVRDGEEIHVFTRDNPVRGLADWADLSGSLHISAVMESGDARAGVAVEASGPEYANVGFWNSVQVESGRGEAGLTYTYREKFFWKDLLGVLIDFEMQEFKRALRERYPDLDPELRGQVIGLVKGGLWTSAEQGRWDQGESENARVFVPLVEHLTAESVRLVRVQHPDADESFFGDSYRRLFAEGSEEADERLEAWLEETLPGVLLAGNVEIVYRLEMPGRVVESNAHERDGTALVWSFSPWDAITAPVEIYAESRVGR